MIPADLRDTWRRRSPRSPGHRFGTWQWHRDLRRSSPWYRQSPTCAGATRASSRRPESGSLLDCRVRRGKDVRGNESQVHTRSPAALQREPGPSRIADLRVERSRMILADLRDTWRRRSPRSPGPRSGAQQHRDLCRSSPWDRQSPSCAGATRASSRRPESGSLPDCRVRPGNDVRGNESQMHIRSPAARPREPGPFRIAPWRVERSRTILADLRDTWRRRSPEVPDPDPGPTNGTATSVGHRHGIAKVRLARARPAHPAGDPNRVPCWIAGSGPAKT